MASPASHLESALTESYFLDLMSNVADDKTVEKLAIYLNIQPVTIHSLKRQFASDNGLLATKLLMAWRNNLMTDTVEEAQEELAIALSKVGLGSKAKQVYPPIVTGSGTATPSGTGNMTLCSVAEPESVREFQNPPPGPPGEPLAVRIKRKFTAVTCYWIVFYLTLGLLVMLFLVATISLRYLPKTTNAVLPSSIKANDTAELTFDLPTTWLQTISLSIDNTCDGTVYTFHGKCSDLYSSARVCHEQPQQTSLFYLLPGSNLNFSVPANFSSKVNVWIIWNNPDLIYHNFSNVPCDDPLPDTHCLKPQTNQSDTTHLLFNVTRSAYYTFAYSPDGPHGISLNLNVCSYDVSKLSERAVVQKSVLSDDLTDIDILYKSYSFNEVCTIFHVQYNLNNQCYLHSRGGELTAEVGRRQDILLFPGVVLGAAVLLLLVVGSTHVTCAVVRRRRAAAAQYQAIVNTEEHV